MKSVVPGAEKRPLPEAEDRDVRLGQLAYRAGFVTESDLEEALLEQERRAEEGFEAKLGALMVEMGFVTERQVDRLLGAQAVVHAKVSRIGPYVLIAKLGEGGMGAVYQARDARTGDLVALKILPRSRARDQSFLARFEQESRAVFELDHPNVVRAVGMGEADGYHYLAMEYVDGRDVYDILEEKGRIPELDAVSIVIQIAQALEHAAEEQVVHRDVKPGNILVDHQGLAKLTDFGLALDRDRVGRGRITEGTGALGTAFYLSPELARGEQDIDVRSDIYSLGATLYEMVTGHPPFEGPPAVVMSKHLSEQLPSPSDIDRTLSHGVCQVVQKMMAKRREDRYQTPHDLLHDLMHVYQGREPTSARLPSEKSSVRTSIRPHRRRPGRPHGYAGHVHHRRHRPAGAARPGGHGSKEADGGKAHAQMPRGTMVLVAIVAGLFAALAAHLLAVALRPTDSGGGEAASSPEQAGARASPRAQDAGAPGPHGVAPPPPDGGLWLGSDFESGTTEGWQGTLSRQDDGTCSLLVPAARPPGRGLATRTSATSLPVGGELTVAFVYYLDGRGPILVEIADPASGVRLRGTIREPVRRAWTSASFTAGTFRPTTFARAAAPEKDAAPTISIAAPESSPPDVLALDSICVWAK